MDFPITLSEPRALLLLLTIPPVVALGVLSARARHRDRVRIGASAFIRSLILILITLALAGLQWMASGGPLHVVFLIDESASVSQAGRDAATAYVKAAIAGMGPEDRAGVVLFGERAIVDRALSPDPQWEPFGKHPSAVATNLGDAIQVGSALFPEGGGRRLVLLSDGAETAGQASEVARRAGLSGVQLSVVPLGAQSGNEVSVERVAGPNEVATGQQFDVQVLLKSTSNRATTVSLFDGSDPAGTQSVQLKPGNNAVDFKVTAKGEGFHTLKARVESVDDRYAENNEDSTFTIVRKPPSVLIVATDRADAEPLERALVASKVEARIVTPGEMPRKMENLLAYDAVVLANVSAEVLGEEGQTVLQSYVRDRGRGLVMLGGEVSYGAGGYLRSTLEEVLPVSMDVRTSDERASLAMTFVLDKSGSMGRCHCGGAQQFDPSMRTEYGVNKVEVAKSAIARAASLLNSSDEVGVIGFDDAPHWLVTLRKMGEVGESGLRERMKSVEAAGPSHMQAGLQTAIEGLGESDAQLKHIIMMSDGWTQQADFVALLDEMKARGVTLTTVGVGEGPGELLKELADKGGGRYYRAEDTNSLPDVLLKETVRLVGAYYIEEEFKPVQSRAGPILSGLDVAALPNLKGYNSATAKSSADTILQTARGDPLLASWQYGLGRSVAWTSDMKGRWATDWVTWPQFAQFAGQMVGWTFPGGATPGLDTGFTLLPSDAPAAQDVEVRVQSADDKGEPRNFLRTSMVVTGTEGARVEVPIAQRSPGLYGGVIEGLEQGVYEALIEQRDPLSGELVASQRTGLAVPYPSEYRLSEDAAQGARALLGDVAQLGGGRELPITQPSAAFTHDIASQPRRLPLWPWLLLSAILLFPLDVAVRRLSLTRSDLRQWIAASRQ